MSMGKKRDGLNINQNLGKIDKRNFNGMTSRKNIAPD